MGVRRCQHATGTAGRRRGAQLALSGGVGVALVLAGPLLLVVPASVAALQDLVGVDPLGVPEFAVERASAAIVGDLYDGGDFTIDPRASAGLALSEDERAHLRDVRTVLRAAWATLAAAAMAAAVGAYTLREDRTALLRCLRLGATGALVFAASLALLAVLAFGPLFEAFHALLFPQGNWRFASDSTLIRLFPESFWRLAAIAAATLVVASAAAIAAIARCSAVRPSRAQRGHLSH